MAHSTSPSTGKKKLEIAAVFVAALLIAAAGSRTMAWWLKIPLNPKESSQALPDSPGGTISVAGSSLIYYACDWLAIAERLQSGLHTNAAPSASPCELEFTEFPIEAARIRILGISLFEMTETHLSDARAVMVPIAQTLRDIHASNLSWSLTKRILSRYPSEQMRRIYPTIDRSIHVMVGVRRKAGEMFGKTASVVPTIVRQDPQTEKLNEWEAGRLLRGVETMRASMKEGQLFRGPKSHALARIIATAERRNPLLVVVLPVSNAYRQGVAGSDGERAFQKMLAELLEPRSGLSILRLDQNVDFHDDSVFCDLVHLNEEGRSRATRILRTTLEGNAGEL